MIGLDTNVLVRYIAQDDPKAVAIATDIMERRLTAQNAGLYQPCRHGGDSLGARTLIRRGARNWPQS